MPRERKGFIVTRLYVKLQFTDESGQRREKTQRAKSRPHAQQLIREAVKKWPQARGSITSRLYARLHHTDERGRRREVMRRADNRTEAQEIIREVLRDLEQRGSQAIDASRMTLAQLATHFETQYLKPAEYVDGRKVDGVRSLKPAQAAVRALREHFGKRRLRSITYGDIRAYRAARLKQPTRSGAQRSIATVNRELSKLRRMLNIALREKWIPSNPFAAGEPLISLADERQRERILTREEELRLLEACSNPQRIHLRPIIIAAIDTGMRRGEILSLRWKDLDFDDNVIMVQAFNTKTMRERKVAMTARLTEEIARLYEKSPQNPDGRVFGIADNVKRSFTAARKEAGLLDVRFHDLRHTAATRLAGGHMPLSKVGRILGHTQANTTYRYVNADLDTAQHAAAVLNAFNNGEVAAAPADESGMVN